MGAPIKEVLKWIQEEGEIDDGSFSESKDLAEDLEKMSLSEKLGKFSGIDRLLFYKPEENFKIIVEKIFASYDKRLINLKIDTREIIGVISMTNIFFYAMS